MNKIRVLLADDHAIIRDGIRQILDDTEDLLVAGEAANGIEVMQHIRAASWGLLVLDISMPGRNGIDLIRHVLDEAPNLPILILSMHHEEQYAVRALHAGASGYVTKESDSELLLAAMRRVAAGGYSSVTRWPRSWHADYARLARYSPTPCSPTANFRSSKCWPKALA